MKNLIARIIRMGAGAVKTATRPRVQPAGYVVLKRSPGNPYNHGGKHAGKMERRIFSRAHSKALAKRPKWVLARGAR